MESFNINIQNAIKLLLFIYIHNAYTAHLPRKEAITYFYSYTDNVFKISHNYGDKIKLYPIPFRNTPAVEFNTAIKKYYSSVAENSIEFNRLDKRNNLFMFDQMQEDEIAINFIELLKYKDEHLLNVYRVYYDELAKRNIVYKYFKITLYTTRTYVLLLRDGFTMDRFIKLYNERRLNKMDYMKRKENELIYFYNRNAKDLNNNSFIDLEKDELYVPFISCNTSTMQTITVKFYLNYRSNRDNEYTKEYVPNTVTDEEQTNVYTGYYVSTDDTFISFLPENKKNTLNIDGVITPDYNNQSFYSGRTLNKNQNVNKFTDLELLVRSKYNLQPMAEVQPPEITPEQPPVRVQHLTERRANTKRRNDERKTFENKQLYKTIYKEEQKKEDAQESETKSNFMKIFMKILLGTLGLFALLNIALVMYNNHKKKKEKIIEEALVIYRTGKIVKFII